MSPDDPRHGESRGFYAHEAAGQDPCAPCREAWRRHRRRAWKLAARGVPARLPIGNRIYAKLKRARAGGMTHKQIAAALGVSISGAWKYCEMGPDYIVYRRTWLKLNEFQPGPVLTHTGTVRRVQALHHMGYGCAAIAREAGCHREALQELLRDPDRAYTTSRLRTAIAEVYDRLWDVPCDGYLNVTQKARNRAQRSRWGSALAWDDDAIDNPNAKPVGLLTSAVEPGGYDDAKIFARIAGDRTIKTRGAENVEVVRRMLAAGWSQNGIRRHTGLKVERYLSRAQMGVAA